MKIFFRIFFIAIILINFRCNNLPYAAGKYYNMVVLASDKLLLDHKATIDSLIRHPRELGYRPEYQYNIIWGDLYKMDEYEQRKSIFMITAINEKTDLGLFVNRNLTEEQKSKIRNGVPLFAKLKDVWARDQIVFLFVFDDMNNFKGYIKKYKNAIQKELDKYTCEREKETIWLAHWHDIDKKKRGWWIKVPKPYFQIQDTVKKNIHFIQFKRKDIDMYRSISIGWIEMNQETFDNYDEDGILALRDTIAWNFYDKDYSVVELTNVRATRIKKKFDGFEIDGVWANDKWDIGGLYRSRIFYIPKQKRLYILDATIFAPNDDKFRFLMQFLDIFDTFSVYSS